jgi:hypothetical protein
MFYPSMKSPIKKELAQMIAASHQMYSALKALVDLKEWKNVHGKTAHTLLIETLYGQGRICARAGFKFQK